MGWGVNWEQLFSGKIFVMCVGENTQKILPHLLSAEPICERLNQLSGRMIYGGKKGISAERTDVHLKTFSDPVLN